MVWERYTEFKNGQLKSNMAVQNSRWQQIYEAKSSKTMKYKYIWYNQSLKIEPKIQYKGQQFKMAAMFISTYCGCNSHRYFRNIVPLTWRG